MRNLIVVLLSVIIVSCYAQKPTTSEEYTYFTKGYKSQVEAGIGVKAGYKLVDYGQHHDGSKTLNISGVLRDGETKPCGLLLEFKNAKEHSYLLCPTSDSPEWDNYAGSLKVFGGDLAWADYYIHKLMMSYIVK
jgi:hypothetical protein